MRPRRTKRDLNHAEVRDGCRDLGMVVWDLADLGGDVLDLVVCWNGRCLPIEVKQPGLENDLTEGEQASIKALRAVGVEVVVVTCVEDVVMSFEKCTKL